MSSQKLFTSPVRDFSGAAEWNILLQGHFFGAEESPNVRVHVISGRPNVVYCAAGVGFERPNVIYYVVYVRFKRPNVAY